LNVGYTHVVMDLTLSLVMVAQLNNFFSSYSAFMYMFMHHKGSIYKD